MSYTIKEQLANSENYGGSRNASQIRYLVYHYTGNDGDRAANNAKYFQNNIVKASAHYFGCRSLAACPRSEGGGGWQEARQRRQDRRRDYAWDRHQ